MRAYALLVRRAGRRYIPEGSAGTARVPGVRTMLDALLRIAIRRLLGLRYRIEVRGLDDIAKRGIRGILFLPNHPALIDPVIVLSCLHGRFRPRALADEDQIDRFFVRWMARRLNVRPVPDLTRRGPAARAEVAAAVRDCIAALRQGQNLLLYPSGHIYRSRHEDLRGNSAVETILRECPGARVVLIRTRGLWGSAFSRAGGSAPNVGRVLRRGIVSLLASGVFFAPRRSVTVELHEPANLPRQADRNELNRFLETFYNEGAPPNTYVPYTIWERSGPVELPEPAAGCGEGGTIDVPESTRRIVLAHLRELTGRDDIRDEERLAHDLGMDSLARAELILWLGKEFGFATPDVDSLQTVGDLLRAACGEAVARETADLRPAPRRWFREAPDRPITVPSGGTIPEVFLAQARKRPDEIILADAMTGVRTFRDIVTAVHVLAPRIRSLPGERVGILLPASGAAVVAYLATLFAGKAPVMVNWTTGTRNMLHALELTGARSVLTAGAFVSRVESHGTDFGAVRERFVLLDGWAKEIGAGTKAWAWARGRLGLWPRPGGREGDIAVILFTSGSEALPKAVPLTHRNLLTNIRDLAAISVVRQSDRLVGILPPFHSFGLMATVLAPLLCGVPVVLYPNPTEGRAIARVIEAYKATLLVGTPTFLNGIVRAAQPGQLASLRLAVTGAEKCTERTYEALAAACPNATIIEGYGITECSPMVAANYQPEPRPYTIGLPMPSVECVIVDVETGREVGPGETGMLLVRGPSIFGGYLGPGGTVEPPAAGGSSPFVEQGGRLWYRTGDLVSRDADGVMTFRGRLKRFVKRGGEMISLPAIESVLERYCAGEAGEGPALAVEATPDEDRPELVLFTTRDVDRQTANQHIREAGLSALHNVARVVRLERIPTLGTGKTDYRALRQMLAGEA